ncbi:MAG TPA: alpha/beta fold hydrolase [Aggregatilineales bacterium]|nr:alpha/beta fold hydrolase [Aggregatilineales bacterium]
MANPVSLHYTERGQGTVVVFLHGYPLNSTIWQTEQDSLSDHYRVITPDLRGHGESPAPEGIYEMESLAQDVITLLDSLEVDKAAIMGHSMGGYVTLALWRLIPERFLALGMISSQAGPDSPEGREGRYKSAENVFMEGSKAAEQSMLPKMFAAGLPPESSIVEQVRTMILNTRPSGMIGVLKGMAARPDSRPLMREITVPVLLLSGDKDQLIPLQRSVDMAELIEGATLATIENAGHLAMLEQPQATLMAIRNFLDQSLGETH